MKRIPEPGAENAADINLSPLIDCIFLLLIFFVVYAVFEKQAGMDLNPPEAVSTETLDASTLVLHIDADGRIESRGQALAPEQVRDWVAGMQSQTPLPVVLMADKATPAGTLVRVLDACRLAGAPRILIGAEHIPSPGAPR